MDTMVRMKKLTAGIGGPHVAVMHAGKKQKAEDRHQMDPVEDLQCPPNDDLFKAAMWRGDFLRAASKQQQKPGTEVVVPNAPCTTSIAAGSKAANLQEA